MAQQAPAIGSDVSALMAPPPAAPPVGADVSSLMSAAPDFRSSNERDEAGRPVVLPPASRMIGQVGAPPQTTPAQPGAFEDFASHAWSQIDPIAASRAIVSALTPKALGGTGPVDTIKQIGKAQGAVYDRAKRAYDKGDYTSAAIHFVNYLLPIVGPGIEHATDLLQAGKWAAGSGEAVGLGLAMFSPEKLRELVPQAPAKPLKGSTLTAPDPVVQFARDRGVGLDAATALGSDTARAMQKRVGSVLGGEGTAKRAIRGQAADLTRVGGELADEASATPASAEQAGQGIRDSITSTIKSLHARANAAYTKLREIEQRPENTSEVPVQQTEGGVRGRQLREEQQLGRAVSDPERTELRRILAEMESYKHEGKTITWKEAGPKDGNYAGGAADVVGGHAGAPVHGDIIANMTDTTYEPSRAAVEQGIRVALADGKYNPIAQAALKVAGKRIAGEITNKPGMVVGKVSKPFLPPDPIFAEEIPSTKPMQLAVDLREVKQGLAPIYDRLKREGELAPLMGDKATALRAIDRVMNGPDHAPLSVADAALGDLKSLARTDGVPELRGSGKGVAAAAVKKLDETIQMHAAAAGDDVANALQAGRRYTRAKYQAGDLLDRLNDEPVKVYSQMTAPRDGGIKLLRQVRDMAPEKMADVARAWLQERLDMATRQQGKFQHAARMASDWAKLGKETKSILFPKAGQSQALDHFFELARRIGENPNPSGTAHTSLVFDLPASVGAYPMAKLLYTPGGVRALTRVMSLELQPSTSAVRAASTAAPRAAAWANLVEVAKSAGVDLPKAADRDDRQ